MVELDRGRRTRGVVPRIPSTGVDNRSCPQNRSPDGIAAVPLGDFSDNSCTHCCTYVVDTAAFEP